MLRLTLLVCMIYAIAADVVDLTDGSFDSVVDGSKNVLVEFFAPWCGHCKQLAPEWKIAGETFQPEDGIVIAAVDATEQKELSSRFEIQGFPTIKFFPKGSTSPEDYDGGRDAVAIVDWVNDKVGLRRRVKKAPSVVTDLTSATFDSIVMDPSKSVLVKFYAPWCGHCKQLAPTYEELAKAFEGEEDVVVAKVDVTVHEDLGPRFGIEGFPSLKYFPAGDDKTPSPYEQARELSTIVDFINENAGTQRMSDGTLVDTAGRLESLDELIGAHSGSELVTALETAVNELSEAQQKFGKTYVGVAKKIAAKGSEYVGSEISRLDGMISSQSISAAKRTFFMLRRNVLRAFV